MVLTIGMTGMDPATETALKAAFDDANARLGGRWTLVQENAASHVMVDMDSMYGPMSWLRLHAGGKRVIGLTTAPRAQTDFRLGRPFDGRALGDLLASIERNDAGDTHTDSAASAADALPSDRLDAMPASQTISPPTDAAPEISPAGHLPARPAVAARQSTAADATATASEDLPTASLIPAAPSGMTPAPAPQDALPGQPAAVVVPTPSRESDKAAWPWPQAGLLEWLAPDALERRTRYRRSTGPTLLIDPAARVYHGPSTLKPIAAYFDSMIRAEDFETIDDTAWAQQATALGAAQPLSRLQWLGGLLAGKGALLSSHHAASRFRLTKWPQTEREYPRHFRIATAMMKGPATLAEIAAASGMPATEVADFVNANLVTGFVDVAEDASPEPVAPAKSTGLFGRRR